MHALSPRSLLTVMVFAASAPAATFHVASYGDDTQAGSRQAPFGSLHGAQQAVRKILGTSGAGEPIDVVIHEGTYYLQAPLVLTPEDSGAEKFPVTWRAEEGARAILSGGTPIPSAWKPAAQPGCWVVDLPRTQPQEEDWNFRQLFIDGKRATRARFPNADASNPFLYATGGDMDHILIRPDLVKASWGSTSDAQVNIVPN
jgi:hypothetical protein